MPAKKLKVYGWTGWRPEAAVERPRRDRHGYVRSSCQTREIIAAPSMSVAAHIAKSTPRSLDMCETGNDGEIKAAMANPGVILWQPLDRALRGRTDWSAVDDPIDPASAELRLMPALVSWRRAKQRGDTDRFAHEERKLEKIVDALIGPDPRSES